jgi:hypothetical protein
MRWWMGVIQYISYRPRTLIGSAGKPKVRDFLECGSVSYRFCIESSNVSAPWNSNFPKITRHAQCVLNSVLVLCGPIFESGIAQVTGPRQQAAFGAVDWYDVIEFPAILTL